MRRYEIRQGNACGEPIIKMGKSLFYIKDEDLIPNGFILDRVENSPDLKKIFVVGVAS